VQIVNQLGSWGNYIASMALVERLGDGSAVLVSCVVIVRVLPSLFLFPAAGVVADRSVWLTLSQPQHLETCASSTTSDDTAVQLVLFRV